MLNPINGTPLQLVEWRDEHHGLGLDIMDTTHQAMVSMLNRLSLANKKLFIKLFTELYHHTQTHFSEEEKMMKESGFPAVEEHIGEHRRILAELKHFNDHCQNGSIVFARSYIRDKLPEWFALHLATMDQALAAHMQKHGFPE